MANNEKSHGAPTAAPAAPQHRLACVQLMPGCSVSVGGKWTALSNWEHKKHVEDQREEQHRVRVEEMKSGDLRFHTSDGRYRDVYPWAVAWRMYEPAGKK